MEVIKLMISKWSAITKDDACSKIALWSKWKMSCLRKIEMAFWESKIMKGANSRVIGQIYETPILYVSPKKVARGESFRYYFDEKDFVNNWDQSSCF